MKSVPLTAYPRTLTRRTGVKKLRREGRVPAIVYGPRMKPENIEVDTKEFDKLIHHAISENILVDLTVEGKQRLALVQEVQHHPLSRETLHVDLHEVAPDEKVEITVPVETLGEPIGVRVDGGLLEHVLFKVRVRALPGDLPECIELDVADMQLGQTLHIGDMPVSDGVEILGDPGIPVVSVAKSRVAQSEDDAAAAAAAEAAEAGAATAAPAADAEKKA
ncbi:MAG: 50S ribosomal protein L25 [Verrucomicrobiia bacterium]|jgi:large subunit ribosomal protein L25